MLNDPVPPETSFTTPVPNMLTVNMTAGNYPYNPNQYVPPIMAPAPVSYPLYQMTMEPPLTEERFRQIIREELATYFDGGNDVLSAFPEDDTQS